jgi:hypothetical protein
MIHKLILPLLFFVSSCFGYLTPDGQVVHSEAEHIEAQKIFEERGQTKEYHEAHVFNPSLGELGSMLGQVSEFNKIRAEIATEMAIKARSSKERQEVLKTVRQEDVEKVAALKQRMIEVQKKVALKTKEAAEKTGEINITDNMNQQQLMQYLIRYCYAGDINIEIKKAVLEQQSIMAEYNEFSKGLNPEVKSYFDKVMDSVGDFCHQFNDCMQRSSDITDMYLYLDDTLTDEFIRHDIKESIERLGRNVITGWN